MFLFLFLALSQPAEAGTVSAQFTDIREGDWFKEAVQFVYDRQIMTGMSETIFAPGQKLNRAQFATIIYRMEGAPQIEYTERFPDVAYGEFYTDAVIWASQDAVGIISGYESNGYFGPADDITREQLVVMLDRYRMYKGYAGQNEEADLNHYPDADKVSGFAETSMKWAVAGQIIRGDQGKLNPQGSTNRAECATIIQRLLTGAWGEDMEDPGSQDVWPEQEKLPGAEEITADFSEPYGVPLVKKMGMFQSGLVPMDRTERDFAMLQELKPHSYRLELGFGAPGWIMSDMITGEAESPVFSYEKIDRYAELVTKAGGLPYWAYGYCPYPLQGSGDYKSQPDDLFRWQMYLERIVSHLKESGTRTGYHEVWNEPDCFDVFYRGSWEDYCELYKYGARGIQAGDADAVIGGPSTAWVMDPGTRYTDFLNYVRQNDLPLDFFSMHRYGTDYLDQIAFVRQALAGNDPRFMTTSIHVNEINTELHPWPYGSGCDHHALAAKIFTVIEDMSVQNDVETVSWAQFLESGVDALGVIDSSGHKKASYNAFEIFARMPVEQYRMDSRTVRGMATADEERFSIVLWNDSQNEKPVFLDLRGLPIENGNIDLYRIDQEHCSYGDGAGEALVPVETYKNIGIENLTWSGMIPDGGVVYLEINRTQSSAEETNDLSKEAEIKRQYHYYFSRGTSDYAYFDEDTWTAWLGMGEVEWTDSIVGVLAERLPEELRVAFEINGDLQQKDRNSLLGLRIDFETDQGYETSVLFYENLYRQDRESVPRWGTKRLPDQCVKTSLSEFTVRLSDYAPADWNGRVILTYEMQNSGPGTSAKITMR